MFEPEKIRTLATGLRFPEGPAADRDGSLLVPEIEGAALVRVRPDGGRTIVAEVGGGANGCAFGPDGAVYVTNDGGFLFAETDGIRYPYALVPDNPGGTVQRVDATTGAVETVATHSDGERIGALNDIVFDVHGGYYLCDTGGGRVHYGDPRTGGLRVAAADLVMPNGAGLSPDGARLYVSETVTGRVRVWEVAGPGRLIEQPDLHQHGGAEGMYWDGLALDGAGNVCVADLQGSGIRVISAQGEVVGRLVLPQPDGFVTNLCFGGPSGNTAFVCSAGRGLLYEVPWPWAGLRLNFQP